MTIQNVINTSNILVKIFVQRKHICLCQRTIYITLKYLFKGSIFVYAKELDNFVAKKKKIQHSQILKYNNILDQRSGSSYQSNTSFIPPSSNTKHCEEYFYILLDLLHSNQTLKSFLFASKS